MVEYKYWIYGFSLQNSFNFAVYSEILIINAENSLISFKIYLLF